MRLNKDVCRRCRDTARHPQWMKDGNLERDWASEGKVVCPVKHVVELKGALSGLTSWDWSRASVSAKPPEWCEYAAEHLVSQ